MSVILKGHLTSFRNVPYAQFVTAVLADSNYSIWYEIFSVAQAQKRKEVGVIEHFYNADVFLHLPWPCGFQNRHVSVDK